MAYKVTYTCTKSAEVQFQRWMTAGVAEHCRINYPSDSFLNTRTVVENTNTRWVAHMTFNSEASYQTIYNDPIVQQAKSSWDAYNSSNGIQVTVEMATI